MPSKFDMIGADIAWCPGCGNFGILISVKQALEELGIEPTNLVMVSGIGQAAKTPQYLKSNMFNGLHGRALPAAVAIKAANPDLTVITESGDGDIYGEGGNHFIHTIRRNPNITILVHNNMVYGLTKGQASPTAEKGYITPIHKHGVILEPFNPIAVAISLNAGFVARANSGDVAKTKEIIKAAISHKGISIVDIFQPCVVFNKTNTGKWFKENTYYLDEGYDPTNRAQAFEKALEHEKFPLGIIYKHLSNTFEERLFVYSQDKTPVVKRKRTAQDVEQSLDTHKITNLLQRNTVE